MKNKLTRTYWKKNYIFLLKKEYLNKYLLMKPKKKHQINKIPLENISFFLFDKTLIEKDISKS